VKVLVKYLRRVLDDYIDDKEWKWKTFPEYLDYFKGKVGINVGAFVPHSPVRLTVMGEAAYEREATPVELEAMKRTVREGLDAGAIGFSSSPRGGPAVHAGTPSTFASQDEIVELGNLAGEYGGCFQFNGFGNLLKPDSGMTELVNRINTNMIGNEFRQHPGIKDEGHHGIAYLEEAKKRGKDITGIVIPYQHIRRFGIDDCFFLDGLPTWETIKKSTEGLSHHLKDKSVRTKLEQERIEGAGKPAFPEWLGWGNMIFDRMEEESLK